MSSKLNLSKPRSRSFPRSRTPPRSVPLFSGIPTDPSASISDVLHQPHTPEPLTTENSGVIQTSPNPRSFHSDSSKRTSSDKLSALPPSLPASPRSRYPTQNTNRNFRRSLDEVPLSPRGSPAGTPPPLASNTYRPSASEGSLVGKESPRQRRISFESDHSVGTLRSIRQIINRVGVHAGNSPSAGAASLPPSNRRGRSDSQSSQTHSRAASPLRIFQWPLHRAHSREEPFVAVDPFKWHFQLCNPSPDESGHNEEQTSCLTGLLPCCFPSPTAKTPPNVDAVFSNSRSFLSDTLPRQLYLHFLLRLPSLYFSRVARVFEDAEVSKGDMQRIIDSARRKPVSNQAAGRGGVRGVTAPPNTNEIGVNLPFPDEWVPPAVSVPLSRFKNSWEDFIDSLMREWKTLNLVSALLCSAILSMFQVPDMAGDPVTRTAALVSLVCALMSLSYGCMFIVRFGTMRSMHRASRWAEEAQKTRTSILWNVWVLLATPAVWIAWSMIAFIISILSYVWGSGSKDDPISGTWPLLTPEQALGPRLLITMTVVLGLVYFVLIVKTFTRYGKSGLNNEPLLAARGRDGTSEDVTRGREQGRNADGKNGKADGASVSIRPNGIGLGFGLTPENGGGSGERDLEKGGGDGIEMNIQPRGRLAPKL